MRILIHSNGPQVPTGYGVQTALLAERLKNAGHDVAISAYFGQPSGMGQWRGIPLYPQGFDPYSNDILPEHALNFFDGDPLGGWILTLMDVFGLERCANTLRNFNVAAWCPVDHYPVPPDVQRWFRTTDAVPIAMSKFGEAQLRLVGLDPLYVPLAVDSGVYKPTPAITIGGEQVPARELLGIADDAYVVMMNGMNKGWAIHRKGFPHAFLAFSEFAKSHPEAVLYIHSEIYGQAGGVNLERLAILSGIQPNQITFADQYAYRIGMPPELLAAAYTAADVLLAPSMGEGFCVPLIEAQACGTPVIVTDFSAQPELVGAGWKVTGDPWLEEPQGSWMISPNIADISDALTKSFEADREALVPQCIDKASDYDADMVFETIWKPVLAELDGGGPLELDRPTMPDERAVAVLVPVLERPDNVAPLVESFNRANRCLNCEGSGDVYGHECSVCDGGGTEGAVLYFVVDPDALDGEELAEIRRCGAKYLVSDRGSTFAQKINSGFEQTLEPWVFLCGDDVRFHEGWLEAARKLSDRFDVIGTNDHPEGKGNPRVASGQHADHFFVRRSYVDTYGGNLGPGVLSEVYRHFFCDVETIELAKARKVWTPCLDSLVEHMHPDLGKSEVDDVYLKGWSEKAHDSQEWAKRQALVEMQKQGRGK